DATISEEFARFLQIRRFEPQPRQAPFPRYDRTVGVPNHVKDTPHQRRRDRTRASVRTLALLAQLQVSGSAGYECNHRLREIPLVSSLPSDAAQQNAECVRGRVQSPSGTWIS